MNISSKNAPYGYVVVDAATNKMIHYKRSFGWKSRLKAEKVAAEYNAGFSDYGRVAVVRIGTANDKYSNNSI